MLALFPVSVVGSCTCETKDLYHIRSRSPAMDSAQPYSGLSVRASSGCREVCQNLLLPAVYIQFPNSFNFNLFHAITFFLGDIMLIHYGLPSQNQRFQLSEPLLSTSKTYGLCFRNRVSCPVALGFVCGSFSTCETNLRMFLLLQLKPDYAALFSTFETGLFRDIFHIRNVIRKCRLHIRNADSFSDVPFGFVCG